MAKNSKNIIIHIQNWIESIAGQTFLNYAYSWGAAVVILGALFKLTHIPGANAMLFIGMGTEVLVFFISGFDRPAALKRQEEEMERLVEEEEEWVDEEEKESGQEEGQLATDGASVPHVQTAGQQMPAMGTVVIGNLNGGSSSSAQGEEVMSGVASAASASAPVTPSSAAAPVTPSQPFDMQALVDMVNASNKEFLEAAREACAPEMKEAAEAYVEELKVLTETLSRVSEQAESMTRDSKEMENLNRTLTGINTIYEMQLKSISTQVGTIDQINEQTRRMARQIEDLNAIYKRMIEALTVNMKHTPGGAAME